MIIVIEGADGTGKSTLGEEMYDAIGAETWLHAGCKYVNRMHMYHTAMLRHAVDRVERTGKPVIMDRWWPSELVYAAAFRGGTKWPLMGRMMDRVLLRYGGMYIVCLANPDHEKLYEKLRAERFELFKDIRKAVQGYEQLYWGKREATPVLFEKTPNLPPMESWPHAMNYLMKFSAPGAIISRVKERLASRLRHPQLPGAEDNFLGDLRYADTLFVGDKAKVKGSGRRVWPFYEYANSSLYLTSELDRLCWEEYRGVWTNINDENGREVVEHCLDHVGRVVVFGDQAARSFRTTFKGVPFHFCLHPQSARRFPYNRTKFRLQLTEALGVTKNK